MDMFELKAWSREERGSRACGRLRRRGLTPAVLYGRGEPNVLLSVRESDLDQILQEHAFICRLECDAQTDHVQVNAIQMDALGDDIVHADFMRISLTETVTMSVPVVLRGEAPAVGAGGVLDIVMHELEVECLPTAIPDRIEADVSGLHVGDSLRIGDLDLPEGVAPVAEEEEVVITVVAAAEEEEEEELEEVVAEPEVIRREPGEEGGLEEGEGRTSGGWGGPSGR